MPDSTYPLFEEGQTLTAPDLNQLREFLHGRDRLLGRLTGFGVNCGLDGTVNGSALTIGAGLAIDQVGEPLLLPAAVTIALPPTNDTGKVPFAFIDPALGDLSIVLESVDDVEPAPDCGDEDCGGHAEQHTRTVALRAVPGRLTGAWFDFATHFLLDVEPMRLSLTSQPQGSYNDLRGEIVKALNNAPGPKLINPALITKLAGTSLSTSDLPGVKGYKAGFINQVLFATLDLLRCRALMATTCDRTTARPGVVLGWLKQAGNTWSWDCEYRHAWEPPRGLTHAFIGGTCTDPCGVLRDELEALIAGYAPPDPPPSTGNGTGPGPVVAECPKGYTKTIKGKCLKWIQPKEFIDPNWKKIWIDPREPRWNPPLDYLGRQDIIAKDIYHVDPLEFDGKESFSTLEALGWEGERVKTAVTDLVSELGGTAHIVTVSTAAELEKIPGVTASTSFNVGDTVVMVVDNHGKVSAFGRVSGAQIARDMGAALPAVTAAAAEAKEVAQQVPSMIETAVEEKTAGFEALHESVTETLAEAKSFIQESAGAIEATVATAVKNELLLVNTKVSGIQTQIDNLYSVGGGFGAGKPGQQFGERLDQDFAHGMTEFAETVIEGLSGLVTEENQKTLGRYVGDMTRTSAKLEVVAAGGDPIDIGDAAVALLGTMRTAVKAAGVDDSIRKQLDVQFNAVKGMLG